MSTAHGPRTHGASGPLPRFQNGFAFRHQPNSKKTNRIAAIPATQHCCNRCSAIIEWKRKYRKYRPLAKPGKCSGCREPRLRLAYHSLCGPCATARSVCPKCQKDRGAAEQAERELEELNTQIDQLTHTKGAIPGFSERERRSMLRELLRERARMVEAEPEDAAAEAAEADAAAEAAERGESLHPAVSRHRVAKGAAAGGGADNVEDADVDEEEEGEEEDEDEDEGEDDDDDDDEGASEEEGGAHAAAGCTDVGRAAARNAGSAGGGYGEEGLVDPSIFTDALAEAKRRRAQLER